MEILIILHFATQETAKLEAQTFELEQRVQFVNEIKSVLDSWVRYEAQVKQRQQKELAETLITRVKEELQAPKTLNQVLQQSILEIESKSHFTCCLADTNPNIAFTQGLCPSQRPRILQCKSMLDTTPSGIRKIPC